MRRFNRIVLICLGPGLLAAAGGCDQSKAASGPAIDDMSSKAGQECMVLSKEDFSGAKAGQGLALASELLKGKFVRRTAEFVVLQPSQMNKGGEIWIKNEHVAVLIFGPPEEVK